jgi:hypothetical protein
VGILEIFILVLVILWLAGMIAPVPIAGGFVHLLIVLALVLLCLRLARGRSL